MGNMDLPKKDWVLLGFRKSTHRNKKYDAILERASDKNIVYISFGSAEPLMEQYKDQTGLGIYSYLDHNDPGRRERFRQRFRKLYNPHYWSPTSLSMEYLW
jgi:hypothetical protein